MEAGATAFPKRYWEVRELVVIGIFAAVVKVSSILVALVGGGMNPVTLILKNLLFSALLLVLLYKTRKFGTLTLFLAVSALVSVLLLGAKMVLVPASLAAGLAAETLILVCGGYGRTWALVAGVAAYDLFSKALSLGITWLMLREEPRMIAMAVVIVAIGYVGSVLGLFAGRYFIKELRHAGIIHQ